jgi:phosphotransferase system enzyme I (PtsI)
VAPGVAIGPAYLYAGGAYQAQREELSPEDIARELARFEEAVIRSERELAKISTIAHEKMGQESASIFDAQAMILRDPQFYDEVVRCVRDHACGAGWATQSVLDGHRSRMDASPNAVLRERASDFADIRNRVLRNLQQQRAVSRIDEARVVVAGTLTAADILLFSRRGVLGCVIDEGGATSHVAIMARALGVPTVVGVHGLAEEVRPNDTVILDGFSGEAIVNPGPETLERYRRRQTRYARLVADSDALLHEPAQTRDGLPVALRANVEFREELPLLHTYGATGIGLFRTEMLFLSQGRALDEAQQLAVYRDAIRAAAPHAVTFRLLDLGGDKALPFSNREANPFLGWRGIRILLDRPELLRTQLRALLVAAADAAPDAPPQILLPMVSSFGEIAAFRAHLDAAVADLAAEGAAHRADLPVGIMVEVPAVALLADRFAGAVDFFSIGTNDLTQFTLAVDRGNDRVAALYRELNPGVLALMQRTIDAARAAGIPVSVCGETAADPRMTPLLVGLGVDTLSMSPAYLLLVKRVLRAFTTAEARALAAEALRQPDADHVRRLLEHFLTSHNQELGHLLGLSDA